MTRATWESSKMFHLKLILLGAVTSVLAPSIGDHGGQSAQGPVYDQGGSVHRPQNDSLYDHLVRRAKRSESWGIQSYLGCFGPANGKNSKPLLMEFVAESETMDPLWCAALCASKQYRLVGLQNAVECHCGNSLPRKLERADDDDCDHKCHGDPKQSCGGTDLMAIMLLGSPEEKIKKSGEPEVGAGVVIGRRSDVDGDMGLARFRHAEGDYGTFSGNPCAVQPCVHGGTCVRDATKGNLGYKCKCSVGYKGSQCETINPCLFDPCVNEGTCLPLNQHEEKHGESMLFYRCLCTDLFTGTHCESLTDYCAGDPCTNDTSSVCVSTRESYKCICKPGYSGKHCEAKANGTLIFFTDEELKDLKWHYIYPSLFVFSLIAVGVLIHCLRVHHRRSFILQQYQLRIDKGEKLEKIPPDFLRISRDLCKEFFCCRTQKMYDKPKDKDKKGKGEKGKGEKEPLLKGDKAGQKDRKASSKEAEPEAEPEPEPSAEETEATETTEETTVTEEKEEGEPAEANPEEEDAEANKSDNFPVRRRRHKQSQAKDSKHSRSLPRRDSRRNRNANFSHKATPSHSMSNTLPRPRHRPRPHHRPDPQLVPCSLPSGHNYPPAHPLPSSHLYSQPPAENLVYSRPFSYSVSHHAQPKSRSATHHCSSKGVTGHGVNQSAHATSPPVLCPLPQELSVPSHQCRHAHRTVPNVDLRHRTSHDVTKPALAHVPHGRKTSGSRRQEMCTPAVDNSDSDSPLSGSYRYQR